MFELLFKYPLSVFSKGTFVFLGGWPVWLLGLTIVAAAVGLAWWVRSRAAGSVRVAGVKSAIVWLLQTALAAVLLLMLWHPALALPPPAAKPVKLRADETSALSYAVALRPSPPRPNR